jgi:hypothetical protein
MNDHAGWTQDLKCVLCGSDDASKPCTGLPEDEKLKEEAKIIQDLQFVKNAIKNVCENNVLKECSSPTGQHEYVDEEVEGSYSLYCIHCYSSHP